MDTFCGLFLVTSFVITSAVGLLYYSGGTNRDLVMHCGLLVRQQVNSLLFKNSSNCNVSSGPRTFRKPSIQLTSTEQFIDVPVITKIEEPNPETVEFTVRNG